MIEQVFHDALDSAVCSRIRRRAYQIYEQRGRIHGFDVQDWLNAEQEILGSLKSGEAMSLRPEERTDISRPRVR
jgi:hypothetical protein